MALSNTNILIKRSNSTATPSNGSLKSGELAYSYNSNTAFIGTSDGSGVLKIGGQLYTATVDDATDANTASTLVKRNSDGAFAGLLYGVANASVKLQNSRDFSVSGGDITATAQTFDGTGNVTLNASLNTIDGLTAGSYGSTTEIPVFTVAANGRVTSVTTSSISTQFDINTDSGITTIEGGETFYLLGGEGITSTSPTSNTVSFGVDDTVVRSNTAISIQTIDGDLSISGNLSVLGTQNITNTETFTVQDPLIYLAANNYVSDIVDIGFAGNYYDGSDQRHTGFMRNAGDKEFYVFDNYLPEISGNNEIDVADSSFRAANVHVGYLKSLGVVSSSIKSTGTEDLILNTNGYSTTFKSTGEITPSGALTGGNFSGNQIDVTTVGFGTQIKGLYEGVDIRVSADGSGANVSSFNTNGTLTVAGKVTAGGLNLNDHASGAFDKANAAVFSTSTLTAGAILIGDSSNNVTTLSNTTYVQVGTLGVANTITSITVDAYGRFTDATTQAISIDASQVTSGILEVVRGGTGQGSFTTNGIVFGNSTSGLQVTAAAGTSDQTYSNQIMTVNNAGVPVWTTALDGGSF